MMEFKASARRVLVAGQERGGVNQLLPLVARWSEDSRIDAEFLSAPDIVYEVRRLFPGVRIAGDEHTAQLQSSKLPTLTDRTLDTVVAEGSWDFLLTGTSYYGDLEKRLWKLAAQHSIPTVVICDLWCEYERRCRDGSSLILPDLFLALDPRMAEEAVAALGPSLRTEVVGSPHFARLLGMKSGEENRGTKVRFISEAWSQVPEAGINEFEAAEMFVSALREVGNSSQVLLRPHPVEDIESWRRFIYLMEDRNVGMDTEPSWACYATTRMALGFSSVLLVELALAGVPVASLRFPGSLEQSYCLPETDVRITVVKSEADLKHWLKHPAPPELSPEFVELHRPAVDRITNIVLKGAF